MTRPKYLYAVEKRTREAIYNDGERHSKWDVPESYGEWGDWELLTTNSSPSEDPECLHEIIYDLFTGDASDEEFDDANDLAYSFFDRARVYVVIDELEYS